MEGRSRGGQEPQRKEAGLCRVVSGLTSKGLHARLVLGGRKMGRSPHSPTRTFKGLYGSLPGSSHVHYPEVSAPHHSLRAVPWGRPLEWVCGEGGWQVRSLWLLGSRSGSAMLMSSRGLSPTRPQPGSEHFADVTLW